MRGVLGDHRRAAIFGGLAAVPLLAGFTTVAFGWHAAEGLLAVAMAALALLLVLKAAVVALSVGIQALP
ncbi:hypothetical protein BRC82_04490 [Halobacteriales archaeon QS_1_67_19]|nr:MAG: hypothetical protein BRC82_04490 [Halobacteriales archaeon QS_1_67_19]